MSNLKKITIFALLLFLVGGVGSVITYSFNEPTSFTEEKEIDNPNIEAIDITVNNAKVEIFSTGDSKISVEFSGKGTNNNKKRLSVTENGNTLSIRSLNQTNKLISFSFLPTKLKLQVYLPDKLYESLQIEIDNGSLDAEQLNIKDLYTATKNGSINIDNITGDTVMVSSKNGSIAMDNITAGTVTVSSKNGKISLYNVDGEINGKTSNGSISLKTDDLDRSIEFKTNNGSIKIQTKQEPTNAIFDVRVGNGKIKIFGDSNWATVVGNGDNLIKLSADNGSITVTK